MGLQISITRIYMDLFPIDLSLLPPTTVHVYMYQLMVITEHPLLVTLLVTPMVHVSQITALRRVHLPIMSMCVCVCVCACVHV